MSCHAFAGWAQGLTGLIVACGVAEVAVAGGHRSWWLRAPASVWRFVSEPVGTARRLGRGKHVGQSSRVSGGPRTRSRGHKTGSEVEELTRRVDALKEETQELKMRVGDLEPQVASAHVAAQLEAIRRAREAVGHVARGEVVVLFLLALFALLPLVC